jgi:hypothetical protein
MDAGKSDENSKNIKLMDRVFGIECQSAGSSRIVSRRM